MEEQKAVVWYVLERPLVRPNTSYKKATVCISLFLIVNVGLIILLYYLIRWLGILSLLPKVIENFTLEYSTLFIILIAICQFLISGVIVLKPALIGAVRLYQRYAPEHIRRKCLFKPTCSEYTILVIKKYGVIRGVYKAYIRIFKKCRGGIYRIDEP